MYFIGPWDMYLCFSMCKMPTYINYWYPEHFCHWTSLMTDKSTLVQVIAWLSEQINYRKTSNIRRTLVNNKIVDHSDVVGATPVGAASTTSSFLTWHLASRDSEKTATRQYENTVETPYSAIPYTTIFYITRWTHGPQNLQRPIRTLIVLLGFWIKQIFV